MISRFSPAARARLVARIAGPLLALLLWLCPLALAAEPAPLPRLFDPQRHMRISEVKAGMKGYGLSVFKGTKIQRFEVEVLSVLRDFNPSYDVILVSLKGANLEHTGSVAGMSGSPVYLKGDDGKERMVGAFAYGWPLMKDPVGGVQPIEYMLNIAPRKTSVPPPTRPASSQPSSAGADPRAAAANTAAAVQQRLRWDVSEAILLPGMTDAPASYPFAAIDSFKINPRLEAGEENVTRLRPLATPLMTAGLPPKLVDALTPVFKAYGVTPLQAGGIGGSSKSNGNGAPPAELEPGSVMAIPMLTGDVEMTAVGTTTERIGDRVFGFGHPFNNEGAIAMPLGAGEINGVIANLMTSFKLGALDRTVGTLYADEAVGVAGQIGKPPPVIPINVRVRYTDGSVDRQYKFNAAWHPKLTPLIGATAITSAVTGGHDLPEYHTVDYDVTLKFENGQKLRVANTMVNMTMPELFFDFGGPMIVAAMNPFEQVSVTSIDGTVNVTPQARDATILWVNAPRLKYRPGETLQAFVTYRPFRAGDAILPIEFELPRDLPEGTYQFTVSGWEQFLSDERTAKPFRFTAESVDDVFGVLRDLAGFRHDAVYMRLVRQPDGIAIGRTAMPSLPSSRREVMIGAGRSNTTPFVNSTTKVVPTGFLVQGSAQFAVTIDKNAHVETGVGKPPRHESTPQAPQPKPAAPAPPRAEPKPDVPAVAVPAAPAGGAEVP